MNWEWARERSSFGGLAFRPLEERDLATTLRWRQEERVWGQFFSPTVPNMAEHEAWFRRLLEDECGLVFVFGEDDKIAGQVSIYHLSGTEAEFGRLVVAKEHLRRGFGTIATLAMLDLARRMGLRKVDLRTKVGNRPALRIYGNCGFRGVAEFGGKVKMVRPIRPQPWDEKDGLVESIDAYWREHEFGRRKELAELVRSVMAPGMSLLDAGCGTGLLCEVLGAPPWYYGADSSCRMLATAKRAHPGRPFRWLDLATGDESAPTSRFDCVSCFEVLGHMKDIESSVATLLSKASKELFVSIWTKGVSGLDRGIHVQSWDPPYLEWLIRKYAGVALKQVRWHEVGCTAVCHASLEW